MSSFENCMYLEWLYFLKYTNMQNIILFSEKNYKKQEKMLFTKIIHKRLNEFMFYFFLRKIIGLGLKKSWTALLDLLDLDWLYNIIDLMIYWNKTWKVLRLPYWLTL